MNKDLFESQWSQIKGFIRDKWSSLTEEDVRQINGRYDQLIAKLQQRYGYSRDAAEDEVRSWNFDRTRTYAHEKSYYDSWKHKKTTEDHSWLKWLLGVGIPILIIGGYLIHHNTQEEGLDGRKAAATEERVVNESPEDRAISQNIRNALRESGAISSERAIRIQTENGVVTIIGVVPSAQERDLILRTIRNIRNVRQVNNQIQVR